MCGIVGAVAQRKCGANPIAGAAAAEYRGYDSAGVAVINEQEQIQSAEKSAKLLT